MARVLLVEDERSIRQAIRFELEDAGHDVIFAENFNEAVSAFHSFECDVVISDLFLGKGDGIQLLQLVSQSETEIPFIGITAFPETTLANKARKVLKDNLFIKPFNSPILNDRIKQLMAKNHAQKVA